IPVNTALAVLLPWIQQSTYLHE
ncbi:hypothetical protein, partial [Escherichia coli]